MESNCNLSSIILDFPLLTLLANISFLQKLLMTQFKMWNPEIARGFFTTRVCKYQCVCVAFSFPFQLLLKEMDYLSCHIITLISS